MHYNNSPIVCFLIFFFIKRSDQFFVQTLGDKNKFDLYLFLKLNTSNMTLHTSRDEKNFELSRLGYIMQSLYYGFQYNK